MSQHKPVGWFEIYVQDMERAKKFYEAVFQTTLEHIPMPEVDLWAFPPLMSEASGCTGALVKMEGKDSGVGGTIVYFSCEDCAVEGARAETNGGNIQKPKMSIGPYGFIVLAHDPEGNLIGLHSMH